MKNYFEKPRTHIAENLPDFWDSNSALAMLYESMNGMTLWEMDTIIDPVCTLRRDQQRSSFIEGIRIGIRLREELTEK